LQADSDAMDAATQDMLMLVAGWAVVLAGLACAGYVAYAAWRNGRHLSGAWARHKKLLRKEWLARLRHRDLDAFCIEVNNQRAERNEKPIPPELLKKVQYNLMYTIDED
jgi:hypothetical protein